MKRALAVGLVIGGCLAGLWAEPIDNSLHLFPAGTVLYKAMGVKIASLSPQSLDTKTGQERVKFTFPGKWEVNPKLQGVSVSPEAGVVIGADTVERKKRLREIEAMLKKRGSGKMDVYILSGSVNGGGVTYAWPETVRFE